MRLTSRKAYWVPEGGSDHDLKRLLLRSGWRKCTDCGLRRRKPGLKLVINERGIHWLCHECRKKLIYVRWADEVDQHLTATHEAGAEQVLLEVLQRFARS